MVLLFPQRWVVFTEVFRNLPNFFRTFLSMPGIIIGVGALVAMPAMINGMAPYASETIAAKSSLESLTISTKSSIRINGIFVERDTLAQLDEALLIRIIFGAYPARKAALPDPVAAIRR